MLLTDIDNIQSMIAKEFPEVAKLKKIGQTWQERHLKVLELDARKLMRTRGVKPMEGPSAAEKASNHVALIQAQEEAQKKIEEMSQEELLEHNEDNMRVEDTKRKEFNEKYDALSDEDKFSGAAGLLGDSLLQIKQHIHMNIHKHKRLHNKNLVQLRDDADENDNEELSFSTLAKKAFEEKQDL